MAPSPTGEYHIGHIRTLLFNYAYAKKFEGKFIIRIEDTDRKRYVEGAVPRILDTIKSFGLEWDEGPDIGGPYGPYTQSQRLEIYKKYALELVEKGCAYYCFCSREHLDKVRKESLAKREIPKYNRYCRELSLDEAKKRAENEPFVIRLKVPDNEVLEYEDLVLGKIAINSDNLDDQVLIKTDGFPTYHLAVVVDDHLMRITDIIRGSEWISSTPKHILLYRYFGWQMPKTAHIPVFLDPLSKGKMSKRKGSVSAQSFLDRGYLPEAMLNFLALLGWSPTDGKELFSLENFVKNFDIKSVNKANPIFDINKLNYFNGYYIRALSDKELLAKMLNFNPELKKADREKLAKIVALEKERLKTLGEFESLTKFFFNDRFNISDRDFVELLVPKGIGPKDIISHLRNTSNLLENAELWNLSTLKKLEAKLKDKAGELGWEVINVFSPIRVAVTGSAISPPLFESMEILGKEKTVGRIRNGIKILEKHIF